MSARLTNYRLAQLEEKIKIHNNLVERVSMLELHKANLWDRQDELFELYRSGGSVTETKEAKRN